MREEGLLPGAIWHVFHPADTNKIRDFLLKVNSYFWPSPSNVLYNLMFGYILLYTYIKLKQ